MSDPYAKWRNELLKYELNRLGKRQVSPTRFSYPEVSRGETYPMPSVQRMVFEGRQIVKEGDMINVRESIVDLPSVATVYVTENKIDIFKAYVDRANTQAVLEGLKPTIFDIKNEQGYSKVTTTVEQSIKLIQKGYATAALKPKSRPIRDFFSYLKSFIERPIEVKSISENNKEGDKQ